MCEPFTAMFLKLLMLKSHNKGEIIILCFRLRRQRDSLNDFELDFITLTLEQYLSLGAHF